MPHDDLADVEITTPTTIDQGGAFQQSTYARAALLKLGLAHVETALVVDSAPSGRAETLAFLEMYLTIAERAKLLDVDGLFEADQRRQNTRGSTEQGPDSINERRRSTRELLASGHTVAAVAEFFGIAAADVLADCGFQANDVGPFLVAIDAIQQRNVPSIAEISRLSGLRPDTVRRLCIALGVKSDTSKRMEGGGGRCNGGDVLARVRKLHALWPRQNKRILLQVKAEFGIEAENLTYGLVNKLGRQVRALGRGHEPRDESCIEQEAP